MKEYNLIILTLLPRSRYWIACLLFLVGCSKENVPQPSNLDQNYFVINDNPQDSVDHAIYTFYKKTGIASFYTDTIYRKEIIRGQATPQRYSYIKLSLQYAPFGNSSVSTRPLTAKSNIPAFLKLLQEDVIPQLPSNHHIPSILLLDYFGDVNFSTLVNVQVSHGWTSLYGFNTVGMVTKNLYQMTTAERKMYAASILAGIAAKKINEQQGAQLQKDFFSISRGAAKQLFTVVDLYYFLPFSFVLPANMLPAPESIGLLFHITSTFGPNLPREADDMRAYITAAFNYSKEAFSERYANDLLVLKKFNVMRNILQEAGFKLPA